jgi:isocitrate lyase
MFKRCKNPSSAARDRGYSFVSHQQEVGTGYFDEVTTVICEGGRSSVTALTGFNRRRTVPLIEKDLGHSVKSGLSV